MATTTKKGSKKTTAKKARKAAKPKAKSKAKSTKKAKAEKPAVDHLKALQAKYPHVQSIAKSNEKDKPLRVIIACQADYGLDECEATREIATQDAFQVTRCVVCQREFAKRRRRKNPDA